MQRNLWLLAVLLLHPRLAAQDVLQFWCAGQTLPGQNLVVGMDHIHKWDPVSQALLPDSSPLGSLQVAVFRCAPSGYLFHAWLYPSVRQDDGGWAWFKPSAAIPVHGGNDGMSLVWELGEFDGQDASDPGSMPVKTMSKRISFPPGDQVAAFPFQADVADRFEIPGQSVGTYIVEIQRGEARAYLPWRVSSLLVRLERSGDKVIFQAFHAADASPVASARVALDWHPAGDRQGMGEVEQLAMDPTGTAAVDLRPGRAITGGAVAAEGETLPFTTNLTVDDLKPPVQDSPGRRAFMATDRPLYRPGDEVFVKILMDSAGFNPFKDLISPYAVLWPKAGGPVPDAWRHPFGDGRAHPLEPAELATLGLPLELRTRTGNLTGVATVVDADPLTLAGGLRLPSSLPSGSYPLQMRAPGGRSILAGVQVEVQDDARPAFTVRFIPAKTPARSGYQAFAVEAMDGQGAQVPGAQGEWTLFRLALRPASSWFDQPRALEQVAHGWFACLPQGSGSFDIPSEQLDPTAGYRLLVKVKDSEGRRRMARQSLGASEALVRLVLDRPFALPMEPVHIGIESEGPIGSLAIQVSQAEAGNEPFWGTLKSPKAGTVVATFGIQGGTVKLPAGTYLVEVQGTLASGSPIRAREVLLVAGEGAPTPPTDRLRAATFIQDGELRVLALLPGIGLTLHWRLEGSQILARGRQVAQANVALMRIPLEKQQPADAWVVLSTASGGRWFEERIPLERALNRDKLDIRVHPQQTGGQVRFDLEVLDLDQHPVQADLSLAVASEGLYLQAPDSPGNPSERFHPETAPAVTTAASIRPYVSDSLAKEIQKPLSTPMRAAVRRGAAFIPRPPAQDGLVIPDYENLEQTSPDTVLWIPFLKIDGKGHYSVPMASTSGTMRVTAMGFAHGLEAGIGRASLRVEPSALVKSEPASTLPGAPLPQAVLDVELHRAAQEGDAQRVEILLKRGARADAEAPDGTTALFGCARDLAGTRAATLLLGAGADPDHAAKDGTTPLLAAAKGSNGPLVTLLLGRSRRMVKGDVSLTAMLEILSMSDRPQVASELKALLDAGANPEVRDTSGVTPLMRAARKGNLEAMDVLLGAGASANAVDNLGQTPLMSACAEGQDAAVERLLKAGADAKARDHAGLSVLMHLGGFRTRRDAAGGDQNAPVPPECYQRILSLLLGAGFDPKGRDKAGNTELHWAFSHQAGPGRLQALREAGVDPDAVNSRGETFLTSWPSQNPPEETLRMLGGWNLDLNHRDALGLAPLHALLFRGNPDSPATLKAFLQWLKPDIHLLGPGGAEPLAYAAGFCTPGIVQVLLDSGALVSHRDKDGDTPLAQAMIDGKADNIPVLLDAGARPEDAFRGDWAALAHGVENGQARERFAELGDQDDVPIERGSGAVWTQGALTAAVLKGDVAFLQAAFDAGVDLSVPDKKGLAPLEALRGYQARAAQGKAPLPEALRPVEAFRWPRPDMSGGSWKIRIIPAFIRMKAGMPLPLFATLRDSGGGRRVLWSLETPTPDASITQDGVFSSNRSGHYRVVAADSSDPSVRAVAEVWVAQAIRETANAEIRPTHGGLTKVHVGDFQVLTVGGWSGTESMDLVMLWEGGSAPKVTEPGKLLEPRISPLAAVLNNGNVLVCNGWRDVQGTNILLRSAEIFSLGHGKSTAVKAPDGVSDSTRFAHCGGVICKLPDGSVLLAGGDDGGGHDSGAELFDPKVGEFRLLDARPFPSGASTVLLEDGRVLMFGGHYQAGKNKGLSSKVMAYDPRTQKFSKAGTMRTARHGQATVLLPFAKVLVVGGFVQGSATASMVTTARCEVFDVQTGTAEEVGALSEPKALLAAARSLVGNIMAFGGLTKGGEVGLMAMATETYDPLLKAWSLYDHPKTGILDPVLFSMPDGSFFVGGTRVEFDPAKRAELGGMPLQMKCR